MELKNTSDIQNTDPLHCLIYGASGIGKTFVAATAPAPGFLDTDKGMRTLQGRDFPFYSFIGDDPFVMWPNLLRAIGEFEKNPDIKTIVLDSLTTVSEVAMGFVQFMNKTTGKNPTLQDWGCQITKLKELLDRLLNIKNKHIIVTAHEKFDKDEITGRVWAGPMVTGKLAQQIGLYFDEVYRAEVLEVPGKPPVYQLLMRPTSIYTAKSRLAGADFKGSYYPADLGKIIKGTT